MKAYQVDTPVNSKLQNVINRSVVFYYLQRNPNAYRAQVSKELNISAPAVSRVISRLIDEGFVLETERTATASGKRATKLLVNPDIGIVIGIDLIKQRIRIAVSDFMGNILQSFDGKRIDEKTDLVEDICEDIDRILASYGQPEQGENRSQRLKAISLGIPAVFYNNSDEIGVALYKNLENLDLKRPLTERYKVPVFLENVTRLSALAEKHYGIAKAYREIVFIEISNGIGAGIIIDSHIFRGSVGSAGEIGFSRVGTESRGFKADNKGFLEKVASVVGIREAGIEAIQQGQITSIRDMINGNLDEISASMVCIAALKEDPVAQQIIQSVVDNLVLVLVNLILVLDPELLVIGGEITTLPGIEKLIIEPIRQSISQLVPFRPPHISLSSLGEDAGVIGASHLAIESLLMQDFPYKLAELPATRDPASQSLTSSRPRNS